MAGDWIKMRLELQSHPKVVRILSATSSDKFRVIGGLHAVWSIFDQHSEDGVLNGYTPELMDHIIGWPGFSDAMIGVGWLVKKDAQTLVMPEFSEHNGKSAKRRAEDQKRKRDSRKASENSPRSVRNLSAEMRTREEKRRDKNISCSSADERFADFWSIYPRKVGKDKALAAWKRKKLDAIADQIIEHVQIRIRRDRQWLEDQKYIPHPTTFLNRGGWKDEYEVAERPRIAGI